MLIRAYRVRGHLLADLDPLGSPAASITFELDPQSYGFSEADLDREFFLDNVLGLEKATLRRIPSKSCARPTAPGRRRVHAHPASRPEGLDPGAHGGSPICCSRAPRRSASCSRSWFRPKGSPGSCTLLKYPGTKRFGLDGAESAIPALEAIIRTSVGIGVDEIVIGMPHRGRLNVLANIMGKPYPAIFTEFQGGAVTDAVLGSGDVKYHLGTST